MWEFAGFFRSSQLGVAAEVVKEIPRGVPIVLEQEGKDSNPEISFLESEGASAEVLAFHKFEERLKKTFAGSRVRLTMYAAFETPIQDSTDNISAVWCETGLDWAAELFSRAALLPESSRQTQVAKFFLNFSHSGAAFSIEWVAQPTRMTILPPQERYTQKG